MGFFKEKEQFAPQEKQAAQAQEAATAVATEAAPVEQQSILQEQPQQESKTEQSKIGFLRSKTKQTDTPQQTPAVVSPKTQTRKDIEQVLADGLIPLYQSMTPDEQMKFRAAGEVASATIEGLVTTFKATARKIVDIIRTWLATIPRVNKFFLEQESKLKTDKILELQSQLKKEKKLKSFHQ